MHNHSIASPRPRAARWLLGLALICQLLLPQQRAQAAEPGWRDTGIALPQGSRFCVDGTRPQTVLVAEPAGTVEYSWAAGTRAVLSPVPFEICGENGLLIGREPSGRAVRFTTWDPTPRALERRAPGHGGEWTLARDGSLQTYVLEQGRLYASPDGGLSWQERGADFGGTLQSLAVAPADARVLSILTAAVPESGPIEYRIHGSSDGGRSWEQRGAGRLERLDREPYVLELRMVKGYAVPTGLLLRDVGLEQVSGRLNTGHALSTDGGRTFTPIGQSYRDYTVDLLYLGNALLRLSGGPLGKTLERSLDGGQTWQRLANPAPGTDFHFMDVGGASSSVLLLLGGQLLRSQDQGRSWRHLGGAGDVQLASHHPPVLVSRKGERLVILELGDETTMRTAGVADAGIPGGYAPETRHNISPLFRPYWERNGGLAQFGHPKTEPFREYNPADGKIYLVQYFERNRFEYHPELAGGPYEVLLGLLGNQLTESRRLAGEEPFQRVAGPPAGSRYFPETGHTLGGHFRAYWEANGGLALYGYPISQEFMELNPDDGTAYFVQYFERNRFEYHPENQGTRYEVLLGLLGNALLRAKGWI